MDKYLYDNKLWYIRKSGYRYNDKYGRLNRYIWVRYNGKIPDGYIIHHKDGNKLNDSIDNYEIMSKSEHHKLHSTNRIKSQEERQKISKARSKPVLQLLNNKIIAKYNSCKEAQDITGINASNIGKVCNGTTCKTAGSFEWRWASSV